MFKLLISSDSNEETAVGDANLALATTNFYKFIESHDYGTTLSGISVFFMCRDPNLVFKQRIRFQKDSKKLYLDLMLDYNLFVNITPDQRVTELCRKLLVEITPIVHKYKFKDFNLNKFMNNLSNWFTQNHYI